MQDLEAIAQCCPKLISLNISSCRSLDPAALAILLPKGYSEPSPGRHQAQAPQHSSAQQGFKARRGSLSQGVAGVVVQQPQCALPLLTSLDVSYCSLPVETVCSLLRHGCRFQVRWIEKQMKAGLPLLCQTAQQSCSGCLHTLQHFFGMLLGA